MKRLVAPFSAAACAVAFLSSAAAPPASAAGTPTCSGLAATVVGTAGPDRLTGTAGDDVIVGLGGGDVIRGGAGHDVICGNRGADRLVGGNGDDELHGGRSGITRGDGEVIYHRDSLVPGSGDDLLVPGYDGGGAEYRWDTLDFSDAPNGIVADVGADTITGDGNDVVVGGHYAVLGSRFDDILTGSAADDTLLGGDGDDQIRGAAGNDHLDDWGSAGRPAADEDLLDGGPGDDRLHADEGDDALFGGNGADDISSYSGVDRVDGGAGNDDIHDSLVLSADQAIDGGPGRNRITIARSYDDPVLPRIVIDLAAGTAAFPAEGVAFPFAGADALSSYLQALTWYGTEGADKVEADPTFDRRVARLIAHGRGGDDRILGTERPDIIDGGAGDDFADGRAGDDACTSVEIRRSC